MSRDTINIESRDESPTRLPILETVAVQDETIQILPANQITTKALTGYTSTPVTTVARQQRRNFPLRGNQIVLTNVPASNLFSQVVMAVAKFPDEATLRDYGALQQWMYLHSNKRSSIDLCQSLSQLFLTHSEDYDSDSLFHLYLICAESCQSTGQMNRALCYYQQGRSVAAILDAQVSNQSELEEQERKKKKLEDISMKLEFQSKFQCCLMERQRTRTDDAEAQEFYKKLSRTQTGGAEECRRIWREIVLQSVKHPSVAPIGADWLLSFANTCPRNALPHANIMYVALNLLLYHHGNAIFAERTDLDVFAMLNDIASAFDQYGDQSKRFSPIHKMSHVWGSAAIAYYLESNRKAYLVCAAMMRVSSELLGICFCSPAIESLYVLAEKRAPEFFQMMIIDPECESFYQIFYRESPRLRGRPN